VIPARALALILLALVLPAAAKKTPPVLCPDARFIVGPVVGATTGASQVLVVGAQASLEGVCTPAAAKRKAKPKATIVRVVWPAGACTGVAGRLKLQATITETCTKIGGNAIARKAHIKRKVDGAVSRCGDGFVDATGGEVCDGTAGCAAGETCDAQCDACTVGGTPVTTTTTLPAGATLCCQAVGACIDVAASDATALCSQQALKGTLAPAGQVCDASQGTCGAVKNHGARCCQCPAQSPPFPHQQYCFESSSSSCGPVCVPTVGGTCDPVSETCQP